jgi:enoyl-CoA hydratase/carnithine racemase
LPRGPIELRLVSHQRYSRHATAKEWGAVNEIVPADKLLARAREIAERLAERPPLTSRYTPIALTQKLRRIIDEGVGYGLAWEGISAADVARSMAANSRSFRPGIAPRIAWRLDQAIGDMAMHRALSIVGPLI